MDLLGMFFFFEAQVRSAYCLLFCDAFLQLTALQPSQPDTQPAVRAASYLLDCP